LADRVATPTATSNFGVGRRENHDSSDFYARFKPPELSSDDGVVPADPAKVNIIHAWDARDMHLVDDNSVALVVTSPPYFAGKEYEETLGDGHVPATYFDYLGLLEDVFAECARKLEPGGRMAVNVANLGRKPYRSLAADVISILQDRLRLLLRGEIIWVKGRGATSSCAWGSFQSPANPVLRDLTERIIIASKGRFDRALPPRKRASSGLPSIVTISADEFMESTTDVWHMQAESAHRVGHPAPFPVELPERLIHLYTYREDVVLDPFMGSGTTAVAAVATGRRYIGYDIDQDYVAQARKRVAEARRRFSGLPNHEARSVAVPAVPEASSEELDLQARAVKEGRQAKEIAHGIIERAGFGIIGRDQRLAGGIEVNFVAVDQQQRRWFFDVSGAFTSSRAGLRRADTLWRALGKAAVLHSREPGEWNLVFLTTDLPQGGAGRAALAAAKGKVFTDAIEMLTPEGQETLREYASGGFRLRSPSVPKSLEPGRRG
jgi:DNA modification methylase